MPYDIRDFEKLRECACVNPYDECLRCGEPTTRNHFCLYCEYRVTEKERDQYLIGKPRYNYNDSREADFLAANFDD